MITRLSALKFVFIIFLFFKASFAIAQPTLPDIAATVEKGVVVLNWNCQYNGVKAISVLRSADSAYDFTVVGFVKKLDKGVQVFADGHPLAGRNCYKLAVVFSSGLNWRSNHICVNVTRSEMESSRKLPSNDSLQHMIITEETPRPASQNVPAPPTPKNTKVETESGKTVNQPPTEIPVKKITISINADTTQINGQAYLDETKKALPPRRKITLSFDDANTNAATLIISKYIFVDTATGHVRMELPQDYATHHYSVKFFDKQNHLATEVPKINAQRIIIDKRNFQRKGIYKFVLRKDYLELESGYISIR